MDLIIKFLYSSLLKWFCYSVSLISTALIFLFLYPVRAGFMADESTDGLIEIIAVFAISYSLPLAFFWHGLTILLPQLLNNKLLISLVASTLPLFIPSLWFLSTILKNATDIVFFTLLLILSSAIATGINNYKELMVTR